jgi:hypothetical protein
MLPELYRVLSSFFEYYIQSSAPSVRRAWLRPGPFQLKPNHGVVVVGSVLASLSSSK